MRRLHAEAAGKAGDRIHQDEGSGAGQRERGEVRRGAAVPDRGIAESGDQHAGRKKRRDELVHAALYTTEYNEANAAADGGRNAAGPRRSPPRPWLPWRGTRRAA